MDSPMAIRNTACQSVYRNLAMCSEKPLTPTCVLTFSWCVRHMGFTTTLGLVASKVRRICRRGSSKNVSGGSRTFVSASDEVLDLQPGEQVEVKSEREVRATLDDQGRHRGLLWMPAMARFCGKRYTVFKRVETIMLESTGRLRKMRNTVLLTDVMCDDLYGCDRSCFHYWREAWLRRVP